LTKTNRSDECSDRSENRSEIGIKTYQNLSKRIKHETAGPVLKVEKDGKFQKLEGKRSGPDGTRTRDLRRDRAEIVYDYQLVT
jgi:hypothetical protein